MRGPLPWETPHSSLAPAAWRAAARPGPCGGSSSEAVRTLCPTPRWGPGFAQRTREGLWGLASLGAGQMEQP